MRRTALALSALVITSTLTAVGAAPAHADGADAYGKECNPHHYRTHYKITDLSVQPTVTYEKSYQLAPHEQWTTSRDITLVRQVKVDAAASFNSSSGGSISLPGKLLGSLEAKTELGFQASGSATKTRTEQTHEERRFGNPDDRNRKLVFYRGLTRAKGHFTKLACYQHYLPGQSYGPYEVHKYFGKFHTWTDHVGLSHVLCGHAVTGALAKKVKQQYCPL